MTASKRVGIGACVNRYLFVVLYTDDGVFVVVGVLWVIGDWKLAKFQTTHRYYLFNTMSRSVQMSEQGCAT
jgi:hypothetical protein